MKCETVNPCGQEATDHVCAGPAETPTGCVDKKMCIHHALAYASALERRDVPHIVISSIKTQAHWKDVTA